MEIRPAKTIFHISGWPARPRVVAVARSGWFRRDRARNFLSLGFVQSFSGQVVTRYGLDRERCGAGGRISHAFRGAVGGDMLSGDRLFLVSRASLGPARRHDGSFWNDHYSCRACVTRAGGFFPRWSLVRAPRNCDSALVALTRVVISPVGRCFLDSVRTLVCQTAPPPTKSGIPSHPYSGTQKPFHLVMCYRT
jgi:hypothetical protein